MGNPGKFREIGQLNRNWNRSSGVSFGQSLWWTLSGVCNS